MLPGHWCWSPSLPAQDRGFLGYETFSAKTGEILGNLGQGGHNIMITLSSLTLSILSIL